MPHGQLALTVALETHVVFLCPGYARVWIQGNNFFRVFLLRMGSPRPVTGLTLPLRGGGAGILLDGVIVLQIGFVLLFMAFHAGFYARVASFHHGARGTEGREEKDEDHETE